MRTFIKRALGKLNKLTTEQITELLRSMGEENERLESVLQSLDEGLLVCDAEGILILSNKSAERLLPLNVTEGTERHIRYIVEDDALAAFLTKTLEEGDRVEDREFELEVKGQERLLAVSVFPLVSGKRVAGSVVHLEDITERRSKEARLRRAENLASLTTLAAGVAHEIKNPLGSISIHIQLIQKALVASCSTSEHIEKYLGVVNEEIDRLNHIVLDFLFAVRPMDIHLREGDMNQLVSELIHFTELELEQSGITCKLDLDSAVPLFLFDERYMKQALLNLIKNAQAAMEGGGTLTVRTEVAGNELHIAVSDTGTGIAEENISKIFEPYFTTRDSGSGLGLTMVYKIIKEHRGEVSVKSRVGEGTTFTIVLPLPQRETRLISWEGSAR